MDDPNDFGDDVAGRPIRLGGEYYGDRAFTNGLRVNMRTYGDTRPGRFMYCLDCGRFLPIEFRD